MREVLGVLADAVLADLAVVEAGLVLVEVDLSEGGLVELVDLVL